MIDKRKMAENLKTALLILALLVFVIIAFFQIYGMNDINDEGERIVLGVNGTGNETFGTALKGHPVPMGDLIGIVSGGNFTVVDKNADTKTTENFMLSDPVLSSKGNYCVAADFGGNTARLYEKGQVKAEVTTEGKIISVVTNANGFFAVATEETGYNAVIHVYRKSGEPIYRYRIADNTFIDMDISSNNRKLVVCEANLGAGTIGSNVVMVEFNSEAAESVFYVKGNLYVDVHFNKNGSFVCLGNEKIDLYRADCSLVGEIGYNGRTLVSSDISEDDMICLGFEGAAASEGSVSLMEIYDKNGKMRGTAMFEDDIEYICVNGSYAAVSHGDVLDIVKSNGKVKKSFETTSPVKYGAPFATGDAAVIFSGGNTTIVK